MHNLGKYWRRSSSRTAADCDPSVAASPSSLAKVDALLIALGSAPAAENFEARLLSTLQQRSSGGEASLSTRSAAFLYRWEMAAATACLLCILTGGVFVARETATVSALQARQYAQQHGAASQSLLPTGTLATSQPPSTPTGSLATAAARREPSARISTGHRRGRATMNLNTESH